MKCIISESGKTIERVKDEVARQKVSTGSWAYTSKDSWKKATRKVAVVTEAVATEESTAEVVEKVHGLKAKERKNKK